MAKTNSKQSGRRAMKKNYTIFYFFLIEHLCDFMDYFGVPSFLSEVVGNKDPFFRWCDESHEFQKSMYTILDIVSFYFKYMKNIHIKEGRSWSKYLSLLGYLFGAMRIRAPQPTIRTGLNRQVF